MGWVGLIGLDEMEQYISGSIGLDHGIEWDGKGRWNGHLGRKGMGFVHGTAERNRGS